MPDIIITPGTFNPVGTPVQIYAHPVYPKVPVMTLRQRPPQYATRWRSMDPPPVLALPVVYSLFDFITGDITVGVDVEAFDDSKPNFATDGVRYVADDTYIKTGSNFSEKTYSAVGAAPFSAGGDSIDLGLVEVEYGGDYVVPGYIRVLVDFSITITGNGDGATYTVSVLGGVDPGGASGTMVLAVGYPVDPVSDDFGNQIIDTEKFVAATLFRNGQPIDKIYLVIPITGEVSFTIVPETPGAELDWPEAITGQSWSDTLYGATAAGVTGILPGVPFSGYARESWAAEGELTLSGESGGGGGM